MFYLQRLVLQIVFFNILFNSIITGYISDAVLRGVKCPKCLKPCDRITYDPVLSYAALSSQLVDVILNPASSLQQNFHRASDAQDHVRDSYVKDLRVFFNISATYKLIEQWVLLY